MNLLFCLFYLIYLATGWARVLLQPMKLAQNCNDEKCKLPDCRCSGTDIPGNFSLNQVPQIVIISFYSAVNKNDYRIITNQLFKERFNPNGCPITATFYVSHANTDYVTVEQLEDAGHEIAVNSISFRYPTTWWASATVDEWREEMNGQREIIAKFANINKSSIVGIQAPHLQPGGDKMFRMMEEEGFLYDNSWPSLKYITKPLWPYTLDYKSIQDCPLGNCPVKQHKGIWVIPMSYYKSKTGRPCEIVAACDGIDDDDDAYNLLNSNFVKHYFSNRAPFSVALSSSWLRSKENIDGLDRFLMKLNRMNDVYVVSTSQALQWIKNPTHISQMQEFSPWLKCLYGKKGTTCDSKQNTCLYKVRYVEQLMPTCQLCPEVYPCVGNPLGNKDKTCHY